jgi:hypothetical protein
MPVQIQIRRGLSAVWTDVNPILADGELALESDTDLYKVGDGINSWNSLPYGGTQGIQGVSGIRPDNFAGNVNDSFPFGGPNDPQGYLNHYFPGAVPGDSAVDLATSDLWMKNSSSSWENVGSVVGVQGIQGIRGLSVQGLRGPVGAQGTKGSQGVQGGSGVVGSRGSQGTQGLSVQGVQGIRGSQGTQGIQGIQGFKGLKGDSIVIQSFDGVWGNYSSSRFHNQLYQNTDTSLIWVQATLELKGYVDGSVAEQAYTYVSNSGTTVQLRESDIAGTFAIATLYDNASKENPVTVAVVRDNGTANTNRVLLSTQFFVPVGKYYDIKAYHWLGSQWEVDSFSLAFSGGPIRLGIEPPPTGQGKRVVLTNTWSEFLLTGNEGDYRGPQGVQGIKGIQGSQGTRGIQGIQGTRGAQGIQSTQGVQGIQGPYGPNILASFNEMTLTGPSAPTATSDADINSLPGAVTVPGLNAWKNANQLVSVLVGSEYYIYVNSTTGTDRNLSSMLVTPPTTPANAVASLEYAAAYANQILAGSEATAVIRVCPGYYYTSSRWQCNVKFEAWNSTFTAMPFPSNSHTSPTVANNYYDGTGYDNEALIPQMMPWRLLVRSASQAGVTVEGPVEKTNLHICCYPTSMYFEKSVTFFGGFAFLGLAETIKYVGVNPSQVLNPTTGTTRATAFVLSAEPGLSTPAQINGLDYDSDVSSNVDTLLNSIRGATGYTGQFSTWSGASVLDVSSRTSDVFRLKDCIFGPGLPMHKENLGGPRHAYISVNTEVSLEIRNIYLRGNTTITSNGISAGQVAITTNIDLSGYYHYGPAVTAPWTYRQFYHTFISTMAINKINIKALGPEPTNWIYVPNAVDAGTVGVLSNDWYADRTGKLLPNHIHLLTNSTTPTAPNGFTPAAGLAYPLTGDNDNGPFLDQFIHAKYGIVFDWVWLNPFGVNNARPVWPGFLGRFGSNGHNSVKTRGVLLGNQHGEVEGGCEVTAGNTWYRGSPFMKAGIVDPTTNISVAPFVLGSASFGEANPVVKNSATRSITTKDNGSTTLDLNLGLVNWAKGISPEYGTNIRPRNFVA